MKGILLINKPKGWTSFDLVRKVRRVSGVKKVGHAGTLDPFATGVMVILVGRDYTKQSDTLLCQDKEYIARLHLGATTDTYDTEGERKELSDRQPSREEIEAVLTKFQGTILQTPPMYSAKKIKGKKLYELARAGKTIERPAVPVTLKVDLLNYTYPFVDIRVACSKGTYIRSLGHDIGQELGCGAYLEELQRLRSGSFDISQCIEVEELQDKICASLKS